MLGAQQSEPKPCVMVIFGADGDNRRLSTHPSQTYPVATAPKADSRALT